MIVEEMTADVLCVGGGIAGLMAAIRASELGSKVIVAEKGNVLRSGCGAAGNDHFWCYIPEIHGPDIEPIIKRVLHSQHPGQGGTAFVRTWYENSFDIVKLWDSWGIPMKYKGKYEFAGHGYQGGPPLISLKYAGQNQKAILTEQALKRGAKIVNRVMVFDLLGDENNVVGAIGIDTREDKIVVFYAKSIVVGTGRMARLYPGPTPAWMTNLIWPANLTGDGRAMAFRMGAELVNMETPFCWGGPKYFSKGGQGTWVGVIRDHDGRPIGPFVTTPDKRYGDYIAESHKSLYGDYAASGKGPVYMDCRGISEDDYQYMIYWLRQEGNNALLNHLREENIDPRKHPIEFMTYETIVWGGLVLNEKCETSLKGIYGAGDETQGGMSSAATFGWLAGERATNYAKEVGSLPNLDRVKEQVHDKQLLLEGIRKRKEGPDWKEANIALQQIMADYAGRLRSEALISSGFSHLVRLKKKVHDTVLARNQHELMRCIEVFNLLDMGELVFVASKQRKETRANFIRSDFPLSNPLLDKALIVKKVGERIITEWRATEP